MHLLFTIRDHNNKVIGMIKAIDRADAIEAWYDQASFQYSDYTDPFTNEFQECKTWIKAQL